MTEPLDLAGLIQAGDRIAWSGVALEPLRLLEIFESQLDRVPSGVSTLLNISITNAIDAEALTKALKVVTIGGSVTHRRFQDAGGFDVLPVNYSVLPELVSSGALRLDCVFLQVAPSGGAYNHSLMVDCLADAVSNARVVVAEVNDQLPVTFGDTSIAAHDVDHVVHVSRPALEVTSRPARDLETEIGRHVSRLIRDGDTLEVGLGSLPDAVLECLHDKRDLGVHSGTIGDRVVELTEAGIITNAKKPIDTENASRQRCLALRNFIAGHTGILCLRCARRATRMTSPCTRRCQIWLALIQYLRLISRDSLIPKRSAAACRCNRRSVRFYARRDPVAWRT